MKSLTELEAELIERQIEVSGGFGISEKEQNRFDACRRRLVEIPAEISIMREVEPLLLEREEMREIILDSIPILTWYSQQPHANPGAKAILENNKELLAKLEGE
jgi:hypothetical protein